MKLAGIDLNGFHDYCMRSEPSDVPENRSESRPNEKPDADFKIDGGADSVAVRIGYAGDAEVIAGPQAALAPHGRGSGWGEIGDRRRRIRIAEALRKLEDPDVPPEGLHAEAITAAADILARDTDLAVFVIPDTDRFNERAQDKLLRILSRATPRRMELLWRSIAVWLGLRDEIEVVRSERQPGLHVAIITALGKGVVISKLQLKTDDWNGKDITAPVRTKPGIFCHWGGDQEARRHAVLDAIAAVNPDVDREDIDQQAMMLHSLAAGETVAREVVRNRKGRWVELVKPATLRMPEDSLPEQVVNILHGVEIVLLDAPGGRYALEALRSAVAAAGKATRDKLILAADERKVACGALEAARLLASGIPPYFDFLPRIRVTAVTRTGKVEFTDLIPKEEVVPGGKVYRCKTPPRYYLDAGQKELDLYLAREGDDIIRRWHLDLPSPPSRTTEVILRAQQRPARGWARIDVVSEDWEPLRQRPVRLDWDHLKTDKRDENTLLEDLNRTDNAYPEPVVYASHEAYWDPEIADWNLLEEIEKYNICNGNFDRNHGVLLDRLYDRFRLTNPPNLPISYRCYPIDSNGNLPAGLNHELRDRIETSISRMLDFMCSNFSHFIYKRTAALSFLISRFYLPATWCFLRCPVGILDLLLKGLIGSGPEAKILNGPGARKAVLHSLGRCLADKFRVETIFRYISNSKITQDNLACLSHIVSRRDVAFDVLDSDRHLLENVVKFGTTAISKSDPVVNRTTYTYALLLIGGLCRVRRKNPNLFQPYDASVVQLKNILDQKEKILEAKDGNLCKLTRDTIEYLDKRGKNPNLLRQIDG